MRLETSNALSHVIAMQCQPFPKMLNKPSTWDSTVAGRTECFGAHVIIKHGMRHHQVIEMVAKMILNNYIAHVKAKMKLT